LFNLIRNEQMKLFIQKSTWIMFILLFGFVILTAAITKGFEKPAAYTKDNWRQELEKQNKGYEKNMKDPDLKDDPDYMQYQMQQIETNNYYLEHDIQPASYGAWHFVKDSVYSISILSLLTIIVAAGIVANEFRWGTIKLLLIRPISRAKILLSKYLSILIFALILLVFYLIASWIVGALFFGFDGLNPKEAMFVDGKLVYDSIVGQSMVDYAYKLVNLVMMTTFAFMISTVFRNSSLAIGIAIFLMMAGTSILMFVARFDWAKYILFANTDLTQYTTGTPIIKGMTLQFSIIVLLVYYAIFLVASWFAFTKRDVAGA